MTIEEQITIAKADLDAVYAAGKAAGGGAAVNGFDVLKYATTLNRVFYKAEFRVGYEIVIDRQDCPANLSEMFRIASGLTKITLNVQTSEAYNVNYFAYDTTNYYSKLEKIVLPDGIKFSNFANFATRNQNLTTVSGAIDLSESTSNDGCFAYCPNLLGVEFVPETIKKSISFAQSTQLSRTSIESILAGLYEVGDGQTLTLSESAVDTAYAWDGDMGKEPGTTSPWWRDAVTYYTENGWTITLM